MLYSKTELFFKKNKVVKSKAIDFQSLNSPHQYHSKELIGIMLLLQMIKITCKFRLRFFKQG